MMYRLHDFLTAPGKRLTHPRSLFWLGLAIAFAAAYATLFLREAFSGNYLVQDDARQHVFWMWRFVDPELFPGDLIADYFQSVAPAGYTNLYRLAAAIGIEPFLFNKLLPVGLLLITAGYTFGVCYELFPVPAAAFGASLLLSQALGMTDTLISGTQKAFLYPLFMAFLFYLLRRSRLCWLTVALLGLFYPQMVLVAAGILALRLLAWRNGRLSLCPDKREFWFCAIALGVIFAVMLPYAIGNSEYGPTISASQARELPEFVEKHGRSRFFYDDEPARFWLEGRSGIRLASALTPATNAVGFVLLFLPILRRWSPLTEKFKNGAVLVQLLGASMTWYFAAHAALFKLHLPSRYSGHSLRILFVLSAAIALFILIDGVWNWAKQKQYSTERSLLALGVTVFFAIPLLVYPAWVSSFPTAAYKVGSAPQLYRFLQQQPKDTLLASLSEETNNVPSFARRSILVGSEYAIPYHLGYYRQVRQRLADLIEAQYSFDKGAIAEFIQQYGIDFWLLDRDAFELDYVTEREWIAHVRPEAEIAAANLALNSSLPLQGAISSCTVLELSDATLLDARCILSELEIEVESARLD